MKINESFCKKVFSSLSVIWFAALICSAANAVDDKTITNQPADDEFGRLFTAQYERNAIDRARLAGDFIPAKVTGIDENSASASVPSEALQPFKVLGVLLRADGKNKVWLSGGKEAPQNILNGRSIIGNINQSANVKVGLNNGAILKPGQVWSPLTGRQEAYQIPVPKPVMAEVLPTAQSESRAAASKSSTQTSSVSSSEVSSSVQSSAK